MCVCVAVDWYDVLVYCYGVYAMCNDLCNDFCGDGFSVLLHTNIELNHKHLSMSIWHTLTTIYFNF